MTDAEFLHNLAERLSRLPTMFDSHEVQRVLNIAELIPADQTAWHAERDKTALGLVFSVHEWRVIAVSCGRINRGAFISEDDYTAARSIASQIARETGKLNSHVSDNKS